MRTLHLHLNGEIRGGHFHGRLHVRIGGEPCGPDNGYTAAQAGEIILRAVEVEEWMNSLPRERVCAVLRLPTGVYYQGVALDALREAGA